MARKINISKYQGNTVYSVSVTDSYGQEHHLGYWQHFDYIEDIEKRAEEIWANEVKNEPRSMDKAIAAMIKADKTYFTDDRGNHRDGLD